MQVIAAEKRSSPLKRADFGCLRRHQVLNLSQGCLHSCIYCYARGYSGAPSKGTVHLYRNLPSALLRDLDNPRRRREIPVVAFNTATDCFQPHPDILETAYSCMRILLSRGVAISFLTKGRIPSSFIRLFAEHPGQVRARIGMVSPSEDYRNRFEPGAAPMGERLQAIRDLHWAGARVSVRVDPIIPFYTDDTETVSELFRILSENGVSRVSLSYLQLRPWVLPRLEQELTSTQFQLLSGCFRDGEWSQPQGKTWSRLVPLSLRRKGYERFRAEARRYGIIPAVCACKNPDISGQICDADPGRAKDNPRSRTRARRPSLLDC